MIDRNNGKAPITPELDRYEQIPIPSSSTETQAVIETVIDDASTERPEKVEFTPAQQLKLDDIIKKSMGRAGSEARAEAANANRKAAELQAELERIKAGDNPDSSAQLKAAQLHVEALQRQLAEGRTSEKLSAAIAKGNWIDSEVVAALVRDSVAWNADKNELVVLDKAGLPRLNAEYEPLSMDAFLSEFAQGHLYLVRGTTKSGTGSAAATRSSLGAEDVRIEQIFGKNSNAALANRLALQSPREYAKMKLEAKRRGLI